MSRLIIGLLIGLVLGGTLVFYLFIGVPKAVHAPGTPISAPDLAGQPAGTAQIVLGQEFFNQVLSTIFRDMSAPTFPLAEGGTQNQPGACGSQLTLVREGSGVQSSVRFDNNRLSAPLAFNGSYNSMFGCFQFTGWAQANLDLRYDASRQAVFGQINIETVNLDGVNPLIGGILTPLVQSTLNSRVNPILLIDGPQIAVSLPIAASNGTLQAAVKDVRGEVKENALHLYLTYDFQGSPLQPAQ
ncbi:MAG TPA: hypothetical protein VL572_04930 [Pyrinomonadaceae bacterium]|nr:hypothetical protein [Pyrinomonadaceae bacterium]